MHRLWVYASVNLHLFTGRICRIVMSDVIQYRTQKTYEKQHTSHVFHVIFAFRISKSSKAHTRKRVQDLKLRISIMLKGQPLGLELTSFTRDLIIICINFLFTLIVKIYYQYFKLYRLNVVLFSPFCEVAQVLIISIFNQIWQYSEYESRKS